MFILSTLIAFVGIIFMTLLAAMTRYKRCPSDAILVVYGKVGAGKSAHCSHGGAKFVIPLIQNFEFLSLAPMTIDINLKNALSMQNIRVDVPSRFTIAVSTVPEIMQAAAERLLHLSKKEIEEYARDIIYGQLRTTIATMTIEEINSSREEFEKRIMNNVESELKKLGLKLINVNITDITDESGYIEQLGKKAAAEALNQARKDVAEKTRDGAIGENDAQRDQRIQVAQLQATAIDGENASKKKVAMSNADRIETEEEAKKKATIAQEVNKQKAMKEAYDAQKVTEEARRATETARQEAEHVVPAEIEKKKVILAAEAEAEKRAAEGRGEGDRIKNKLKGEADGTQAILEAKAKGIKDLVAAAGGAAQAVQLLTIEQIKDLTQITADAIKNIKMDKVIVWDGMQDGKSTTAGWLKGMAQSVPMIADIFNSSGLDIPKYLGTVKEDTPSDKKETGDLDKVFEQAKGTEVQ